MNSCLVQHGCGYLVVFHTGPYRGWLITLNGATVCTELIKKGDVKDPHEDVMHAGSDHPQGINYDSIFPYCSPVSSGEGV